MIDQNYELQMRLDQNRSGTTLYTDRAVAAGGLFSLVVSMNGVLFYPIEVSGNLTAGKVRNWTVHDQALPLPYNLGGTDFNSTQFFNANGTLSEQPWIIRKHQAFRPVADATMFYGSVPQEFTNTRLIGRSVWNSRRKIVIPAYTLLQDEQAGLNRFAASVKDIQLFLRTYSNSGN
jgi:hypothetical protein